MKSVVRTIWADPWWTLTAILVVALGFRLYDLDAVPLVYDEPQDLPASLRHAQQFNPFVITDSLQISDPSQARLPYYLTAIGLHLLSSGESRLFWDVGGRVDIPGTPAGCVMAVAIVVACIVYTIGQPAYLRRWGALIPVGVMVLLVGVLGPPKPPWNQLVAARIVAALVGALGVWATYMLGRDLFRHEAGLFAAATLAVSPASIAWSRCAVTSGDTFVTTFFTIAVWLMYRCIFLRRGRALVGAAFAMGLAIGAKLSAILLWPMCVIYALLVRHYLAEEGTETPLPSDETSAQRLLRRLTAVHLLLAGPLTIVFFWPSVFGAGGQTARCAFWLMALVFYAVAALSLVRTAWRIPRRADFWIILNLCLGGAIVGAFCTPYHLRVEVLGGIKAWWTDFGGKGGHRPFYPFDLLAIVVLLAIHTGFPVNVLSLGGLFWSCKKSNRSWGLLILIGMAVYIAAVTVLHQKASYYLMPMSPLLHVVAGGALVGIYGRFCTGRRVAATVCVGLVVGVLGWQAARAKANHPVYMVDGYGWERHLLFSPMLRPEILDRQGARPMIQWLTDKARPGSNVALFFRPAPEMKPYIGLVWTVVVYEVKRSPATLAKALNLEAVVDPRSLAKYPYVILFPSEYGLESSLSEYDLMYECRIGGISCGRVYHRRLPAPSSY